MEKRAYKKPAIKVITLNDALLQGENIGFLDRSVDGENVLGKEHNFDDEDNDDWSLSYSVWED